MTAVLLGGGVANAGACQVFAEKEWDGGAGTNEWHDANNWNPDGVPGPTHDVCIDSATSTVFFISGTTDIPSLDAEDPLQISGGILNLTDTATDSEATSLTLTNGTLGGAGTLIIQPFGAMTWSGGTMTGAGTTRISPGDPGAAMLSIQGTAAKTITGGRTLDNQGTAIWTGTGDIQHGTGALMTNSGTFDIQTDADMVANVGGNVLHITNTGAIGKTLGAGTSETSAALENDGTVQSFSGTLRMTGGTDQTTPADVSGGDWIASLGDTLDFGGGNHRLQGVGSSVTGAGTVAFTGGTALVNSPTYEVNGTTTVSGGDHDFNTAAATTEDLTLSGGTLGGTGNFAVDGTGVWTGGTMTDAGTTVINPLAGGTTLSIEGAGAKTIHGGRTLENHGDATWTGTGNIQHGSAAVLENIGIFRIQTDADMVANVGGTVLDITNTGTGIIAKNAGAGTTDIQASVDNAGTIDVGSGTLFINGSGLFANYNSATDTLTGGTYIVDTGATFKFTDADIDVNQATISLFGPGSAIVDHSDVDALGDFADNQGFFAISGDRDLTSTVPVSNSGGMTMGSNSTFTSTGDYTQIVGETVLDVATSELVASGGCVDIQGGVLKGNGTAEPCVDVTGGNVQPGLSPGILNVDGTYGQSAGTLDIEIGGTTAGTQHDQMVVTGAATLGGTLALDTIGSFAPSDGDSFVVMTYASKTGTFGSETWADLDPSLDFTVDYNPTNVTVTISEAGGTATADLRVVKTDAGREPKPLGRGFRYGIKVINLGPDGATEVMLVDTLPDEVAFVSYRSSQGTCTEDTGVVTCDLGSLASGAFAKISIQVRATGSGTATNTVTVSAAESDPVLANNTDSEDTSIAP